MDDFVAFVQGASSMGFAVGGLYFLRFWRQTRDRLFGIFALAFWMLALNRVALIFVEETSELGSGVFVIRLLGYVLIVVAIVDKNRGAPRDQSV